MAKYTVKQGDNLFEIAKKYGVTAADILDANPGIRSVGPGVVLTILTTTPERFGSDVPSPIGKKTYPTQPTIPDRFGPDVPSPIGRKEFGSPQQPVLPKLPTLGQPIIPTTPTIPPPAQPRAGQPTFIPPGARPTMPTFVPPGVQPRTLEVTEQPRVDWSRLLRRNAQYPSWYTPGQANWRNIFLSELPYSERPALPPVTPAMRRAAQSVGLFGNVLGKPQVEYTGYQLPPEEPPQRSPFTDIYQQRYGIPTVGGEEQGFILGDFRDTELPLGDEIQERVNEQKAEVKGTLLKRGVRPMNFTDFERKVIGKSDEEMNEMGYVWDEEQQLWIHSDVLDDFPQTVGAALPGYGYTYNYPRGYGYGRGGEYTYPQSFARQGQRGRVPSMVRNRPGSFGVVLWRI